MTIFGASLEDRAKDAELSRYLDNHAQAQKTANFEMNQVFAVCQIEQAINQFEQGMDGIEDMNQSDLLEKAEDILSNLYALLDEVKGC